ncbi:O-antigen polymerase [Symbiopectobacterium sp. Eva_TO]
MAFWLFSALSGFYVLFGFIYMSYPDLKPLGAMDIDGVPESVLLVFAVGYLSVATGYYINYRMRTPRLSTISKPYFQHFSSVLYMLLSVSLFLWGVSFYGGYITFLNTPYSPIFELSDNELKDVLISTSGLLSVFSILSSMSGSAGRFKKTIIILIGVVITTSIFIQGRRESLLILLVCIFAHRLMVKGVSIRSIIKSMLIAFIVALVAGIGLYIREDTATSGGNIFSAIGYAIIYETHFTIATLANEIRTHLFDGFEYSGIGSLLQPILFIIPSFIFSIFGLSKTESLGLNIAEPKLYDDKGGAFIFSHGIHSLGYVGVVVDGLIIGFLLSYFYKIAKEKGMIFFYFPIVSLILVAIRKDVTYGVKYISLQFMLIFVFYIFYSVLPKKR